MRIVIAAGGTAGHINPGIQFANYIKKVNPGIEIVFIGTSYGLEKDMVSKAGFDIELIHSRGLSKNIIKLIKSFYYNALGLIESVKILKKLKPKIIIGMGGYVCAPVLFAGKKILKIPVYIHESNVIAGKTNRFIDSFADGVAVGFESAKNSFSNQNIVVTGNMVREEIQKINRIKSHEKNLLVFGGSQGSAVINNAMIELICEANGNLPYNLTYATGKKQYEYVIRELKERNINISTDSIKIVSYIENMAEELEKASLVVGRSGAITISELCVAGVPAILIPLSTAAENHQEFNAGVMVDYGVAKLLHDDECNSVTLKNLINQMFELDLDKMGRRAKEIVVKDACEQFYKMIEKDLEN